MKPVRYLVSLLANVMLASTLPLAAQTNPAYDIATWRGFKTSAVSYTMDDNGLNQLAVAIPLFNQYNFKTTLFTVTGWNPNWGGLRTAAAAGHEIASHTVTHTSLSSQSAATQALELQQSQTAIQLNVPGAACATVAYPNCFIGDLNALQTYYIAGRRCSEQLNPRSPVDFFYLNSFFTGTASNLQTSAALNATVETARSSGGWCIFTIHGIDNDGGYSPTQSSALAGHLAYVQGNSSDFWVATFGETVKYIKERNAATLTETAITADSLRLVVADNLPNSVYNVPVTLRRQLPAGWANARVWAGNALVASTISTVGSAQYLTFEAVPDQGPVYLAKASTVTATAAAAVQSKTQSWPNPFTDKMTLALPGKFSFAVYSLDGKLVEKGRGMDSVEFGSNLIPGAYTVRINQDGKVSQATIIKK